MAKRYSIPATPLALLKSRGSRARMRQNYGLPSRAMGAWEYVRLKDGGRVAQLVEQCPFKAWVAGSNPAALTKISKHLADFGRVDFGTPDTRNE